jgi:hypothetical protein
MMRQIPLEAWTNLGPDLPVCVLPVLASEAKLRFGLDFDVIDPQLLGRGLALIDVDGSRFLLSTCESAVIEHPRRVEVWVDSSWPDPAKAVSIVCAAFGVSAAALPWIAPGLHPRRWVLERLDDNSNRFVMGYFDSLERATRAMERFRARGHKQLYDVREVI